MDLLNQLTENLGVTQDQAKVGTGLIMRMAKEKLGSGDFGKIGNCIPNVESLIKSAPAISGTEKALNTLSKSSAPGVGGATNLAALTNGFSKIGLDSRMVERFVPIVLSFVQAKGGDTTRNILEKLLR